jgi:hypothetical protein
MVRYRVPVFNPFQHNDFLGYLPLPFKYYAHWMDLCYQIVYQCNAYDALREALKTAAEGDVEGALNENYNSVAARLKYLLYARGMIIEEMLSRKGQTYLTLPTFNEFIIKNRFDYCWLPEHVLQTQPHISADPFSDEMQEHMGLLMLHVLFSLT